MDICPIGDALIDVDRRTDLIKLIGAFREYATNAYNKFVSERKALEKFW
jgi:hypothetical protein